jgi:hypothetical protein
MIRLDTVNRSLTLFLGGAQVTAPLQIVVSYSDQTSATYLGSTQLANSNGTTAVTICSAPVASVIRDIDMVTVLNTDSATQTVTIQLLDTATTYKIITVTLLVGDKLTYTHGSAWQVVNNAGNIKYSVLSSSGVDSFSGGSTGLTPATATTGVVTLGGTLAVASGGTGTATPALVAGTNVTITGSWPNQTVNATSSGTVTSVTGTSPISSSGGATPAISLDASYGDTQNPYASKTANYVLAAPNGAAGVPTFRAIVAADIPTLNQNTTGNATTATTATNIAGGTNLQIPFNTGSGATSFIAAPTITSTYLQYNGTGFTWAAAAGLGTVTSVAATVPSFLSISGSPITTAGTLAISYSGTALPIANGGTGQTTAGAAFNALSPITTTGDLILGNGANSATRLGIGTNGYVLTSNGTTASWAAAGSAGKVLQVVSTTNTSFFTTTSASFTDITGLSVSITPTLSTSKVLVICNVPYGASVDAVIQLVRNSTAVGNGTAGSTNGINDIYGGGDGQYSAYQTAFNFLDSPATTSATTYKIQILATGSGTAYVNRRRQDTTFGGQSTITVMEIAA